MSKEIRNCATADVAEDAQGTPKANRFDTAAVAECEERVVIDESVIGSKQCTRRRYFDRQSV